MKTEDITARLDKLSENDYFWLKKYITEGWFIPSGFINDIYQGIFDPENFNPHVFIEDDEDEYIDNMFGEGTTPEEVLKIIEFLRNEKDSGVSYSEIINRLRR